MPFEYFVNTEDLDQTGRNLKEKANIVANFLAQANLEELFAAGGGRVDQVPAKPDG